MIPGRKLALIAITETYKIMQIPLFSFQKGIIGSFSSCDDPGLYLYIPVLSYICNVDAWYGAQLFTWGLCSFLFFSFVVLIVSVPRSLFIRLIAILIAACLVLKLSSVYDVYIATAGVFAPIILFLFGHKRQSQKMIYISAFLLGLMGQSLSLVRLYAFLPPLCIFLIFLLGLSWVSSQKKIIVLLLFVFGAMIPKLHYSYAQNIKNNHLLSLGHKPRLDSRHGFWHNIYIGFGFTRNPYNIVWHDSCSVAAARKVNSQVKDGTPEYEKTVKRLIWELFKKDRHFILTSLFARLGVVIMFFLLWFGWIGIGYAYFFPKPWYEEVGFLFALGVSALPGILTIPNFEYLTGFITCTVLYTIYSMICAFDFKNKKGKRKSYESCSYF